MINLTGISVSDLDPRIRTGSIPRAPETEEKCSRGGFAAFFYAVESLRLWKNSSIRFRSSSLR